MRKLLNIRKIWHTGTLDPLATGCLLVATWNYTKLIPYFEKDTKEYECSILLDWESDSYDIDTPVRYISQIDQDRYKETISFNQVQSLLQEHFIWTITQVPPKYSALKIWGKKAVDLVREGKEVEMQSRQATIHDIEILDFAYPKLKLRVSVSAGTYIRSIAHDLWNLLGTGGYIETLRRTKIGKLDIHRSTWLVDLDETKKIHEREMFWEGKFFAIEDTHILWRLSNGQRIRREFSFPEWEDIFLLSENKVQYIVRYQDGLLTPIKKIF